MKHSKKVQHTVIVRSAPDLSKKTSSITAFMQENYQKLIELTPYPNHLIQFIKDEIAEYKVNPRYLEELYSTLEGLTIQKRQFYLTNALLKGCGMSSKEI